MLSTEFFVENGVCESPFLALGGTRLPVCPQLLLRLSLVCPVPEGLARSSQAWLAALGNRAEAKPVALLWRFFFVCMCPEE